MYYALHVFLYEKYTYKLRPTEGFSPFIAFRIGVSASNPDRLTFPLNPLFSHHLNSTYKTQIAKIQKKSVI